jgi:hypothetical protein
VICYGQSVISLKPEVEKYKGRISGNPKGKCTYSETTKVEIPM